MLRFEPVQDDRCMIDVTWNGDSLGQLILTASSATWRFFCADDVTLDAPDLDQIAAKLDELNKEGL